MTNYQYTATITSPNGEITRLDGTYTATPDMTREQIKANIRADLPFEHLMYGTRQHIEITKR